MAQPSGARIPAWGWVLLGGIGCGLGALLAAKTISDRGTYSASDYQEMVDRWKTLNSAAMVLDVVGCGVLAVWAVWP